MKETLHIYIRVSTSVQESEGTSLKTQKEIGIELSEKLGMNYKIHNEGGISSSKDTLINRPVLMNILRLMDEGEIKNLYVWNTDRLSRNQITWYTIRQKMVKNGVILYTSNGVHDTNDFMENMILGILSEVSQYDNKVRSERSRLGKIEKVKLNYWRGGDCPYGYKLEHDGIGNRLVENEDESKWIWFIYSEYSKGIPLKDIKSILEEFGVKTRRGNKYWSMGSLQVILRSLTYLGIDQYIDKKSNLIITNNIPQLISNKLWEEVQERRKLKLLRKNQINRTKKSYLFRDFLICSCGTPMGGRIKNGKSVQHYYCPLSERRFNNSYKKEVVCNMKRCLNIPTTDKVLWGKIIDVLSDSIKLKETLKEKTMIGMKLSSSDLKEMVRNKNDKITELKRVKSKIEKGLVSIETDNILNKYPSEEMYKSLRKELTKKYNNTQSEIDVLTNSLKQVGNDMKWFEWIDKFGTDVQEKRDIPDNLKKELLRTILDNIVVDYDNIEKVHRLTINFKIPVIFQDEDRPKVGGNQVSIQPTKSGRKRKNQNEPVRDYSTVVNLFPTSPDKSNDFQGYSLRFSLQITSSYLWSPPYSQYQQELFDIISKYHDKDGWNFKQISDWLRDNNYLTPRGHIFTQSHTWSIYQKKNRSIQRFSREFEDTITDMSIDVVDIPVPKE